MPESYGGSFTNHSETTEQVNQLRGQARVLQRALETILVLGLKAASQNSPTAQEDLELCGHIANTALAVYPFAEPISESSPARTAENLNFSDAGLYRMHIRVFGETLRVISGKTVQGAGHPSSVAKFDLEWCSTQARNALDFKRVDAGATFGEPAAPGG